MWVLASGSAHARPSARPPIDTGENFPAHVSAESTSRFHYKVVEASLSGEKKTINLKKGGGAQIIFCLPKYVIVRGVGGVPDLFF